MQSIIVFDFMLPRKLQSYLKNYQQITQRNILSIKSVTVTGTKWKRLECLNFKSLLQLLLI